MRYPGILEEELKNKVAKDFFAAFDCTPIIGKVDFCVCPAGTGEKPSLLWAEAKKGVADIHHSLVQLILTVGKARTFDSRLPPAFLGAFDAEKIAFLPYNQISDVFYQNDFNWKVAPSNHDSKEFRQLLHRVRHILETHSLVFDFLADANELKRFIHDNFIPGKHPTAKIKIDKNNFIAVYNKWLAAVKPSIAIHWDVAKKNGILDGDFYLADLLSRENETLKDKLFVLLKSDKYILDRKIDDMGMFTGRQADFKDGQKAHRLFWNRYERPPKEEYWDYIVQRRDLLVPQDVRERKGSFYTPQIWVELSQKYLADVLGEDWQDEYYVWDCAAGTGNLLAGLSNKYNIWASTIDKQDVDVMKDRIKNGANLLEDHVFQFDFLNDDFSKLPPKLKAIIDDPEKRKKLVVYINPPYAEGDARIGKGRRNIHESKIHDKYQSILKRASGELFAQFLVRIYQEMKNVTLANFSKLKNLQAPNFSDFRKFFRAGLEKIFLVPADTFDNVKGQFPIGFMIWDTSRDEPFTQILADVYDENGRFIGKKNIFSYDGLKYISDWLEKNSQHLSFRYIIGNLASVGNDFQNQNTVFIEDANKERKKGGRHTRIGLENLIVVCVYFTVRKCIPATWLNDRDQFLWPNETWETDAEFQSDCLAYALFHGQNQISAKYGVNHWIPFTEGEVNAREKFDSNFMTDFIKGKLKPSSETELISTGPQRTGPLEFSAEARAVFDAGRELWRYYHAQPGCNVNASLYDIREHFQGRNAQGKMNNKSEDARYNGLIGRLRDRLWTLAQKLEPKVYEHGFLRS